MKILIINCGSSTIKFQLIDMSNNNVLAKGRCDQLGLDSSNLMYKGINGKSNYDVLMKNHTEGMKVIFDNLIDENHGVISSFDEISAVGHRVVHGGDKFSEATIIDENVINVIDELSSLAPLHNPGCLMGIKAVKDVLPNVTNVAVFDTAFHQSIPDYNYMYAIDYDYYEKYGIRKYGFHGTSYMYILSQLERLLNKPKEEINAIVCHIGSGASMCAIKNGKSYNTSMGLTPLEGLMMETRSGDIDVGAVFNIMQKENLSIKEMDNILNKKSGRFGICGTGDYRLLLQQQLKGNKKASLALNMQRSRNKKYIGSYIAELGRVDAIVFTGGIGENNPIERELSLSNLENLGIIINDEINNKTTVEFEGEEKLISSNDSKVKVFMIRTNEELEIANQTKRVVDNNG